MIGVAADRLKVFNLRELRTHPLRVLVTVGVVAVSAALMVAVFGITGSVTGSVDRLATSIGGGAQLEISGVTDGGFDQSLRAEVDEVPGVDFAVPMVRTTLGSGSDRILLLGVDQTVTRLRSDLERSVRDQLGNATKLLTTPNGVVVGATLGRPEGSSFDVAGVEVTVVAVIDGDAVRGLNSGEVVVTTIPTAQRIADRAQRLDSVLIGYVDGADHAEVRTAIEDIVDGRAVVAEPSLRAAQAGSGIMILRYSTMMAAAVALVVAAFLIYTVMNMAVSQRYRVISTLRAIGGSGRAIVRDLVVEAALLGLVGAIVGSALGVVAGRVAIANLPPAVLQSVETKMTYVLPAYAIPVALALSVIACLAAAALAARDVYRVAPIEALAPQGSPGADRGRCLPRLGALILAAAGIGAVIAIARGVSGRASVAAVGLAFIAAICLCFALRPQIVAAAAWMAAVFGIPGVLGATSILRSQKRSWATAMTVAIAVAMIVSVSGSNKNGLDSATDYFASLARSEIWVSSQPADVIATAPTMSSDISRRVAEVPGVAAVEEGQIGFATVGGARVMLQAFGPETNQSLFDSINADARAQIHAGAGVAISRDLSQALGVGAGDELELRTPHGVRHPRVLAVVPYFSGLAGAVAIGLPLMSEWFDRPGSTYLEVHTQPGAHTAQVEAAVRAAMPSGIYVYSGAAAVEGVGNAVEQAAILTTAITWIVGIVAAIALLNTLTLSVLERRRELGVLRALGGSRRFLVHMILTEAGGIAIVGALAGLLIGVVVQYLNSFVLSEVIGLDVAYGVTPLIVIFAFLALLLTLAGAVAPAIRAAHLNIIEAIEAE
ncbi:ABC transporter permease [Nocardia sp. NPDC058658]|uniref:ABC transporter permease n=1 Tax=Nocardia sp. NPDC058658 TaxID=3346580 RepID=UPI0036673E36